MLSMATGLSMGDNSREISAREVKLGHFQEGLRAWKKRVASTMNDAERCSSSRLVLAMARLTSGVRILIGLQPKETRLSGYR